MYFSHQISNKLTITLPYSIIAPHMPTGLERGITAIPTSRIANEIQSSPNARGDAHPVMEPPAPGLPHEHQVTETVTQHHEPHFPPAPHTVSVMGAEHPTLSSPIHGEVHLPQPPPLDTSFTNLISHNVSTNTEMGRRGPNRSDSLLAGMAGWMSGIAQGAGSANIFTGMGIFSGLSFLRPIIARAALGRRAINAASEWVHNNTDWGWGPFRWLHRVATAPARWLHNRAFNVPVMRDLQSYGGDHGATRRSTLTADRAIDLSAVGVAAKTIQESAAIMATEKVSTQKGLAHLSMPAVVGEAIYTETQAKIADPKTKEAFFHAVRTRAQLIEDAILIRSQFMYTVGMNALVGLTGAAAHLSDRWVPVAQNIWKRVTEFGGNLASKARDIFGDLGKAAWGFFNWLGGAMNRIWDPIV